MNSSIHKNPVCSFQGGGVRAKVNIRTRQEMGMVWQHANHTCLEKDYLVGRKGDQSCLRLSEFLDEVFLVVCVI